MAKVKKFVLFAAVAAAVLTADLVTKTVFEGKFFSLIPNVIGVHSTRNFGIAWSMFENSGVWLTVLTGFLIAAALSFWLYLKLKTLKDPDVSNRRGRIISDLGFAFFIGGALGNFIDRAVFGYVRDFIRFEFVNFPIFNVADICLNSGVVLLAVFLLFFSKNQKLKETGGV